MGDTGQVHVQVHSADDLLAVAEALEQEAAARYRGLSARMARQGDMAMAAQFEALAAMEDRHVSQVVERSRALVGHGPDLARVKWETPPGYDEGEARGAGLGAYQALAFAVRNEERSFVFYSYISAEAKSDEIRALAEDLARDELQHAAILRQYRRRTFHQQRPATLVVPENVASLQDFARRWDAEAAKAHAALSDALHAAGDTEDAAIFRRLAAEEAQAAEGAAAANAPELRSAADGLRILEESFDRFASIAERAKIEDVVAEAQRLASRTITRLAMAGGARGNTLLGGGAYW